MGWVWGDMGRVGWVYGVWGGGVIIHLRHIMRSGCNLVQGPFLWFSFCTSLSSR